MRDAVICSPVRTPVGRFGGVLQGVSAASLDAGLPIDVPVSSSIGDVALACRRCSTPP